MQGRSARLAINARAGYAHSGRHHPGLERPQRPVEQRAGCRGASGGSHVRWAPCCVTHVLGWLRTCCHVPACLSAVCMQECTLQACLKQGSHVAAQWPCEDRLASVRDKSCLDHKAPAPLSCSRAPTAQLLALMHPQKCRGGRGACLLGDSAAHDCVLRLCSQQVARLAQQGAAAQGSSTQPGHPSRRPGPRCWLARGWTLRRRLCATRWVWPGLGPPCWHGGQVRKQAGQGLVPLDPGCCLMAKW